MIEISFQKHRSINFEEVLFLAHKADTFAESEEAGKTVYKSVFKLELEQIECCIQLCRLCYMWKDFRISADGKPIRNWSFLSITLDCYRDSLFCPDFKAHCWRIDTFYHKDRNPLFNRIFKEAVFSDSPTIEISREDVYQQIKAKETFTNVPVLFPCKRIRFSHEFIDAHFQLHPSSIVNRIKAQAVEQGIYFCPRYKDSAWEMELSALLSFDEGCK